MSLKILFELLIHTRHLTILLSVRSMQSMSMDNTQDVDEYEANNLINSLFTVISLLSSVQVLFFI